MDLVITIVSHITWFNLINFVFILAHQVQVIEGSWLAGRGVAILSFQSFREAELWKDSVPEIRQPDWLDGVDFLIVPVTGMPRKFLFQCLFVYDANCFN